MREGKGGEILTERITYAVRSNLWGWSSHNGSQFVSDGLQDFFQVEIVDNEFR